MAHAHTYERSAYVLPEDVVVHQQWKVADIVAVSLKHMNGNVSVSPLQKQLKQELSNKQVRDLCDILYEQTDIEYQGVKYRIVKKERGAKYLEPIEAPALPEALKEAV